MPPFFYDIRYFLVIFVTIFEPLRNHFGTTKYPVNFRGIHFGYFRNQNGTIFEPQSIPNISSVHDQKPKITESHLTEIAKSEKPRKYELRARAKNKYAKPCNKKTPRHRTTHKTRITSTCRPDKTSGLRPSTASAKGIKEQGRKPRDITSRVFFRNNRRYRGSSPDGASMSRHTPHNVPLSGALTTALRSDGLRPSPHHPNFRASCLRSCGRLAGLIQCAPALRHITGQGARRSSLPTAEPPMTFVPLCPTSCNDGLDRRRRAYMSKRPCTRGCIENKNAPKADVRARTRADATLSEASPRPATTDFRAYRRIRASQTMDHGEAPYDGKRTPVMYADVTPDDLCHHRTRPRIKKKRVPSTSRPTPLSRPDIHRPHCH